MINETIGLIFIVIGVLFDAFGCISLLRFPDVYSRLQAAVKCVTLGTCGIMLGILVKVGFSGLGIKLLAAILLILITSPVTAHALARGAHMFGVKLWEGSVCDKYQDEIS